MARTRGEKIDGWLNLDKPAGVSSAQAVARVRRLYGAAKAGHGGTLDPLATGVLPIALGEATKTVAWVMDGAKAYRFAIRWGVATATDDTEGEPTATSDVRPGADAIRAALPAFRGEIAQRPPSFSALKVGGRRAYALARAGETVELAVRQVRIDAISLVGTPDADHAVIEIRCGKGTYVRSLARDLAVALGTVGHVAWLRRTLCGPFGEGDAVGLAALEAAEAPVAPAESPADGANPLSKQDNFGHRSALLGRLRPVSTALDDIPALALTDRQAGRLSQGLAVRLSEIVRPDPGLPDAGDPARSPMGTMSPAEDPAGPDATVADDRDAIVRAMAGDRLVAIARIDGEVVRPVRVLNL
ncbi:MAG: tRNA pseudouridine(55) synthase TruB [Rhodospirillales bacterium]|nr:MAG: tRNA pseudouridine(55) synthase TruB [Rhodospirillales bacterium]